MPTVPGSAGRATCRCIFRRIARGPVKTAFPAGSCRAPLDFLNNPWEFFDRAGPVFYVDEILGGRGAMARSVANGHLRVWAAVVACLLIVGFVSVPAASAS